MTSLWRRLIWWIQRRRKESEVREELAFHLEKEIEERRDGGLTEDEARWAAQRDLGNEARVREDARALWTWRPLDELSQDLTYAFRTMLTHRVVTMFAVVSLALGIGANTAIYSFMDAALMRTLPVPDADSLVVMIWNSRPYNARAGNEFVLRGVSGRTYRTNDNVQARIFPYPAFERLREVAAPLVSSMFAVFRAGKMNVLVDGQAELTDTQYVSGDFFQGIGIPPAAGRLLDRTDDRPAAESVAVLSAGYAERRFGSIANAVGREIRINDHPFTVAGVTPATFDGVEPGATTNLYLPLNSDRLLNPRAAARFLDQNYYWVEIMGRLRPGVSMAQANSALSAAFTQWVATTASNDTQRANLPILSVADGGGGLDTLKRRYAKPLYLLQAIVGLILAIACANTASLLLARSTARQREIAVRLSIGAGRLRLVRQLLTESLVLAGTGGIGGVLLAIVGTKLLSALLANGDEGLLLQAAVNWKVLLVTVTLSLLCGLAFGLVPAIQATHPELVPALKDSGARRSAFPRSRLPRLKLQQGLVVAQIALLMLLLVGAGLFARTLANLQAIPLGFDPNHLLLFDINAPQAGYPETQASAYYAQLLDRFAEIPGLRGATMSHESLIKAGTAYPITIDGERIQGHRILQTGPGFFSTLRIPLLAGREIEGRDRTRSVAPAVINDLFARTFFPNENPVGRRLQMSGSSAMEVEIVGVAAAAHYGPVKIQVPPVLYVSYSQVPPAALRQMTFALRTEADPLTYIPAVRQIVQSIDPRIPVTNFTTQTRQLASMINQEILLARICGAFAIVALVIACAGLYGTLAYAVARRTREIGIRIALGARRAGVIWMVLRQLLVLTMLGLILSIPLARGASRFVASFLFEMQPNDPTAIAVAVLTMICAALLAGYGPARRAARVDPTTALRHE